MKRVLLGKRTWLSTMLVLVGVFLIKLISAENGQNSGYYINAFFDWIKNTYGVFFAGLFGVQAIDDILFAKVLFFILIFAVVFMSLKKVKIFKRNRGIKFVIATIFAILAIRYIKADNFIQAFLLPYAALGGSIVVLLPLIVYFFFVHTSLEGGFARRFAWFIFGVIFIVFWANTEYMASANWIYISALIFVIVSFIFDHSIHVYFELGDFKKVKRQIKEERAIDLADKIHKARSTPGMEHLVEELEERYEDLIRRVKD